LRLFVSLDCLIAERGFLEFVMRKSFAGLLVVAVAMSGSASALALAQGQGALSGLAQSSDRAPLANFRVQVRNANTGDLVGSTTSNQAGQFSFGALQPGTYVVEIVDATGRVVGLSSSLTVTAGAIVTVTVGATVAGALSTAGGGGLSLLGLGPLASVAVAGAASAAAVTAVVATRDGKLVVCHRTSATSSQTLEINGSARDSHVGHGDTLGACAASPSR
jgi:hypothetical protein